MTLHDKINSIQLRTTSANPRAGEIVARIKDVVSLFVEEMERVIGEDTHKYLESITEREYYEKQEAENALRQQQREALRELLK